MGDGGTSAEQSPVYTYTEPGLRDVSVDMETAERSYNRSFPGLVAAYADTILIESGRFEGTRGRIDIYVLLA